MARVVAHLEDGYRTSIQARHHQWIADEPDADGNPDMGPSPTEMLRGALGACIAITMKMYAVRKKWPLEGVEVAVDFERFSAGDYPDYQGSEPFVHEFRIQIALRGPLSDDQRQRLRDIGSKCPVRRAIAMPAVFVEELVEAVTPLRE